MESKRTMMKAKPHPKKNLWKPEEDLILKKYVETHGEGNWATVSQQSGLMRGGKSCRLRWKNYLRPNIKRGRMSKEEEDLIIRMHKLLGNRWSLIAGRLPGRTDNEVKNYWNTHLNKRCLRGKRKAIESNCNIQNNNDEDKNKRNKISLPRDHPHPIISEIQQNSSTDVAAATNKKDDSISTINPMVNDIESFIYDITSPLMPANNATFVFDDEPFIAYMDSFVLLEAFGIGCSVVEEPEIGSYQYDM